MLCGKMFPTRHSNFLRFCHYLDLQGNQLRKKGLYVKLSWPTARCIFRANCTLSDDASDTCRTITVRFKKKIKRFWDMSSDRAMIAAINITLLFQWRSGITSVTYNKYLSPIDLMEPITVHWCMFTVSRLQPSFQRERGCHTSADSLNSVLLKSKINLGGIHSKCYWWVWLCGTSLKKIYHAFKRAAGEAEGEMNSNDDGSASWADEVYYYPPASAAAAGGCVDTDEDEMTTHINQQRLTGASGTCQSGGVLMAISNSRIKGIEM